jgi:hypothetical protein
MARATRIITAVVTLVALGSAASVAAARAAVVQTVDFTVTYSKKDRHKTRGGLTLRTTIHISDDTGAKPPPLTNTTLRFPKGAVVNARFFKTCSPSRLRQRGVKGCPAASKIGAGTARGDARPIIPNVPAKITLFNGNRSGGNPSIIVYAQPEISAPIVLQGTLKYQPRGRYGYVLDLDVPPIPTLPGQPNASVVFFDATTLDRTVRRGHRRIHYIEGPVLCRDTFFLLDGSFSYEGGITNTVFERFRLSGGPRCPR